MRISDWSSAVCSSDLFNRLSLDRATQELTRQYNNRGKYNVEISPSVSKLDRNRVDVTLTIKEGKAAKIRHINLIGNEKFEQEDLTDSWESAESNWLSWYRRDDRSEEHTSELQSLMRISYAVISLKNN